MPHYVIQRDPKRFAFETLTRVQADSVDRSRDDTLAFYRDGALCYTLPTRDVVDVSCFETALAADAYIKEQRQWRSGRATVHVSEHTGVATRPVRRDPTQRMDGSAIPAEGIRIKTRSS